MSLHAMQVNQVGDEMCLARLPFDFCLRKAFLTEISFTLGMKPKGLQLSLGSGLL